MSEYQNIPRPAEDTRQPRRSDLTRWARPIVDEEILKSIRRLPFPEWFNKDILPHLSPSIAADYLATFEDWILASKLNDIDGLSSYRHRRLTAGILQSYDDFLYRHRCKRLRFLHGEYPYPRKLTDNWECLGELLPGDSLVVTAPFSATGCLHESTDQLLRLSCDRKVPVLLDCSFLGICRNLRIDTTYPCIESLCFSNSKAFASGSFKTGIEFSRCETGSIATQNRWNYLPLLAAKINTELMKEFSPDYIFTKYRPAQEAICRKFELQTTDTVIIGLGGDAYDEFAHDGVANRCILSAAISRWHRRHG
jgi:hypothetical protein